MVKTPKKSQGFIAITSLLIISIVGMIFALSILKDGIDNSSSSLSSIFYETSRINANICLEDTLVRIKQEETYTRNLNYAIAENESCSTIMTWGNSVQIAPNILERTLELQVTGISHNFSRTFNYVLRIARFDVNYPTGELDYLNSIDILSITESTL